MKALLKTTLTFAVLIPVLALAQEDEASTWTKSVRGGLNLTQTGFDNWAAGGENAFAWQMNLNYSFVRDLEKTNWSNTGKLLYGATKTGDVDMRKSADEIKVESVLTYKLGAKINPYVAVTGETQFDGGYDYSTDSSFQISAFLDPGYFRESLGAGFSISEGLGTRLGLSFKQTVTSDYPAPYADDVETNEIETLRSEVGAESVTDFTYNVSENAVYVSKLELFSAFAAFDEIDANWDNTLTVKVSEYINMNVNFKMVYDKDISVKRQIKQSMAFGLNYTFI
ncbi:MAG: DUF3078 domain-containing protein [Candidatus Marinimicrobia bacterium]|jgi:hypothetical protein|nr:DUF3078 domain-containing protein [Candidatus Neomarinimicrobiota bacterium]MBT3630200.1 DUF3078 domain-containing protein [Candidatus Neomarinimicrobiota bacterium]MBT3826152.1 DUF3078 domain-containing protein [Candidatus Neomarinimicrobiota bacterium]MBT4132394.1 DUF3078 domain-containing protein [Candidatus Neomarinimicrobiota bacterium]MBT4294505.1 DUF3078 domain-containing protein [Candidatus Neomarinimicrobiota bacterium]